VVGARGHVVPAPGGRCGDSGDGGGDESRGVRVWVHLERAGGAAESKGRQRRGRCAWDTLKEVERDHDRAREGVPGWLGCTHRLSAGRIGSRPVHPGPG
jgi:hypothetical protein